MENAESSDCRKDLITLLDCLKLHEENKEINETCQVLKAIVLVCSNNSDAKDVFRELDGLSVLFHVMCKTRSISILECSLNALANAMDKNVHNQRVMSRNEVFEYIRGILKSGDAPVSLTKQTLFFTSVLLFQNNKAQILVQQTDCVQDLIATYQQCFPGFMSDGVLSYDLNISEAKNPQTELWFSVNRTLCFAVNNPLNANNQVICSSLFPMALRILQASSSCEIMCAVSTFLTVTLENNVHNKNLFAEYDGLVVLKFCFLRGFDYVLKDITTYRAVINKEYGEAVLSIVEVVDIVLTDHSQNSEVVGRLGLIPWFLKLLKIPEINEEWKVKVVLTIGHCIDAYEKNVEHLLKDEGLPDLLRELMLNGDKDLLSSCQYLIQVCFKDGSPFAEQYVMEKFSINEACDEEAAIVIQHNSEIIDLCSSSSVQDTVSMHLSQEQCGTDTVLQAHDLPHAEDEDSPFPPEQSDSHVNMNSVATVHNKCNSNQNNSLCHGENTEFPSQQPVAEPVSQACEDDDVILLDEPEETDNLCCDYCLCVSHVISKYTCGCALLHGCRCQNLNCVDSCHMYCPMGGKTESSNHCAKYGCEKICEDALLCRNPHSSRRKTLFDKFRKKSETKHMITGEAVKPDRTGIHPSRSNISSSSSESISKFLPKLFFHKDTNTIQDQSIHVLDSTLETSLKENKCVNLKMGTKLKAPASVFKKPQKVPIAKLGQTALQNDRLRLKSAKVHSRCHSSPSSMTSKTCSEALFKDSLKHSNSVNKTPVSFSPFRKLRDLPESDLGYKMEDSKSNSEVSASDKLSVFDVKLLRASRHTGSFQAHPSECEQRKSTVQPKVKVQRNNENKPMETISKYFVSSKQSMKQDVASINDQPQANPDVYVSPESKQSPRQKNMFSFSGSCDSGTCSPHEKKESISSYFCRKSGSEATNERNDTDVQVISVFGSTCTKHNLSNTTKVVHVVTLET